MKGFAMLGMGKTGWIEKARPVCGALDAIVRPIAVSPCTSDVHTVWEGALGERKDMILGTRRWERSWRLEASCAILPPATA